MNITRLPHSFKLLLFGLAVGEDTHAQQSFLPASNSVWHTHFWDPWTLDQSIVCYMDVVPNDTTINDTTYHKLFAYDTWSGWPGSLCGGIFDDGEGRVYYHHVGTDSTYVLSDYNVVPGDSVTRVWIGSAFTSWSITRTVYVVALDSFNIGGLERKAIGIVGFPPDIAGYEPVHWWIQGIGGTGGLLETSGTEALDVSGGLECMSHGDTILWQFGPAGYPGNCLSVGINDYQVDERQWFHPSITTDLLLIDLPPSLRGRVEILSSAGRIVRSGPLCSGVVPVIDLKEGFYVFRLVQTDGRIRSGRFIKQ